jgi:5'-3' exonuclease
VDALSLLYKARYNKEAPHVAVARCVLQCRRHGVEPVFVFDGKTPTEKRITCDHRKKQRDAQPEEKQIHVTSNDRNQVKQFLYAAGCLTLNAEGEADAVLAFLERRGDIAAIVSSDLDFLPRGCAHLILPAERGWQEVALARVLADAKLTMDQFVNLCLLLGCDYTPAFPTFSHQSAYWILLRGSATLTIEEVLAREGVRNPASWLAARALLEGTTDTLETLLSGRQREKLGAGAQPSEVEVLRDMWGTWEGFRDVFTEEDFQLLAGVSASGGAGPVGPVTPEDRDCVAV